MTEQQAAYLAGAIAHANDSLDWIEARRQGPLPEVGYARIETTVGVVRALAGRETTVGNEWGIGPLPVALIERQSLKAENARLRERVAALEAERDALLAATTEKRLSSLDDLILPTCVFCDIAGHAVDEIEHEPWCPVGAALAGQPAGDAS